MAIIRTFANVTDDGLLFSNIQASEVSVGTTNSALGDIAMVAAAAVNGPTGAIAGLRWGGFVAGASGTGSSITVVIDYDVTSTNPLQLISAIRTNSFVPDTAVPLGVTLSLTEEIFDVTHTLVASSTLTRTQSINDTVDPPFELGDLQLTGGYSTLHVRATIIVSISEAAAAGAGSTFSVMTQTFNTAAATYASLGDYAFEDENANGIQDSGEAGIAGVTVQLLDAAGVVVATTTTGQAGEYSFTGLIPGTYSTRFVTPDGYVPTAANQGGNDAADSDAVGGVTQQIILTSGEHNGTLDAGFYKLASLGDFVFEDRNGNGVQDSGEAGIAGVTVQLLNAAGAVVATTTTGQAGEYSFTGLIPGTYSTRFVTPDGYVPTAANQGGDDGADSDAVGGMTQQVTLNSGEFNGTLDAGFYKLASLGDYVFEDRNANGIQNSGEAGIAGVTVELLNTAGAVVATTTTGPSGEYGFTELVPGTYSTRFITPTGYVPTAANQGGDDGADSDAIGGVTQQIILTSGEHNGTLDAGFYKLASLGDFVFEDRNGNGVQDSGEAGIAGVTVQLLNADGTVVQTTSTGSDGIYNFSSLIPGEYSVRFVTPNGYVPTAANRGSDDAKDSDAVGGLTQQITLASGEYNGTLDAGFYKLASLGDRVFNDANKNGIQDSGETGVGGVTVKLLDAGGHVIQTTATDSGGLYKFTDLPPGTYSVRFSPPSGYTLTKADQGSDDAKDSDANSGGYTQQVTLLSGQYNSTLDAGIYRSVAPNPSLNVTKLTNGKDGCDILAGSAVTWTYAVTNTGNVALTSIAVKDNREGTITAYTGDNGNGILDVGETWIFTETGIATAGAYSNKGTATAKFVDGSTTKSVSAYDNSSYFGVKPGLDVEKYVSVDGGCTWLDADTASGPLLAKGMAVKFKFVVTNTGNVTLNKIVLADDRLDLNGSAAGTAVTINSLAASNGDSCYDGTSNSYTLIVSSVWEAGQHTNTASVSVRYTDAFGNTTMVSDSDAANYFGVSGPGVRTAATWKQESWLDFWDGDASAPKLAGKAGYASGDVLYQSYGSAGVVDPVGGAKKLGMLIGDFNKNGKTDAGEVTVFYTQSEALAALNAANSVTDARFLLDRALVTTWLNFLAGNPLTDPTNSAGIFDAKDAVTQAITWLQRYSADENGDGKGDGSLYLSASTWKVATSASAWNNTVNGVAAGKTITSWLDEYNNYGTLTYNGVKTAIAVDDSVWG